MKRLVILASLFALAGASASNATTLPILYDNSTASSYTNPDAGNANYQISGNGYWVADSFTISGNDIIQSISFGNWISTYGGTPSGLSSINWAITSSPDGGTSYASGQASSLQNSLMSTSAEANNNLWGYDSTFNVTVSLQPGTYYLDLSNATLINAGDFSSTLVNWDISNGPSLAYHSYNYSYHSNGSSNTFTLYGVDPPPSVPESSNPLDLCLAALAIAAATLFKSGWHLCRGSLRSV